MESYSPEISPYIFAVAEGTLVGGLLGSDYSPAWISTFQNNMMRFDVSDLSKPWEGDNSADMAGSAPQWENMVNFFKATGFTAAQDLLDGVYKETGVVLQTLLSSPEDYTNTFISGAFCQDGVKEVRAWGEKEATDQGSSDDLTTKAIGMMAVAVWRFRIRCELHLAMLTPDLDLDNLLPHTVHSLQRIATSTEKVGEVFSAATAPARMVMHDFLDMAPGVDPLKHLSAKARNRILLQVEGYGGFQIRAHKTVTEVLTSFLGNTGLYLRAVELLAGAESTVPDYNTVMSTDNTIPYYGNFSFGAGKELGERLLLGWVTPAIKGITDFERMMEKSFLDSLSPGQMNIGKLVLYLDWYIGGISSWYQTRSHDTSGNLMREEPTPDDKIVAARAVKIDVHFRIADVIACSKLQSDGSIRNLVHHTLDYRKGDVVIYRRKKTVGLAFMDGFKPEDCQFQMLDTLVNKPHVKHGIQSDFSAWMFEKYDTPAAA